MLSDFLAVLSGGPTPIVASPDSTASRVRRLATTVASSLRLHWLFVGLVVAGATLRLLTVVAYPPALFFSDSWSYLSTAFGNHLVSLPYLRPVGYSILIRLLTLPGPNVTQLVVLQHLGGLAIGTLVYVTLTKTRVTRWLAAGASALVLLDGYAITLEQYVMPDTFFALTILVAALVLAWPRLRPGPGARHAAGVRVAAVAGFILAAAAIEREVGLFAIPVFVVYLVWIRASWRPFVAFVIALAVPLGGYAGLIDAKTGVFGITATSGWTLYGRVAGFADCTGVEISAAARPLCETAQQRESQPRAPGWYIWAASSPAIRLFHRGHPTTSQRARANATLGGFAQQISLHQPGDFIAAVAADFLRYFTPGATPYADAVSATSLPRSARGEAIDESIRRRAVPNVHPAVRSPAGLVRGLRNVVHVPRPVLAALALAALIALALRVPARREILLLAGTGLALIVGTSATGGFGLRYLLPAVPPLAVGGGLALSDLTLQLLDRRRRQRV